MTETRLAESMAEVFQSELELFRDRAAAASNAEKAARMETAIHEIQAPREMSAQPSRDGKSEEMVPEHQADLFGVALSGGGIRSATFNLGLLQALANRDLLKQADYLSTVSGGGYIGSCLTTLLHSEDPAVGIDRDRFPLGREKVAKTGEMKEKEPVRRLRYFSNYLTAENDFILKFIRPVMVFLRGVVLNFLLLLPYLLFAGLILALAFNTGWFLPKHPPGWFDISAFTRALDNRDRIEQERAAYRQAAAPATAGAALPADLEEAAREAAADLDAQWRAIWYIPGALFLAMILLAVFGRRHALRYAGRQRFNRMLSRLFFTAGALLLVQLYGVGLAYWTRVDLGAWIASASLLSLLAPYLLQISKFTEAAKTPWVRLTLAVALLALVPLLLLFLVGMVVIQVTRHPAELILPLNLAILLLAGINRRFINLNEISLHHFYRDRLSKAYLFRYHPGEKSRSDRMPHADTLRLSELYRGPACRGPYHLINTTLNLRKRIPEAEDAGVFREGESFLFSANWCGSTSSGYCPTACYEARDDHIDLATAMAISGAAANIGMAQKNLFYLRLLMGLLNVRLGYWAINPEQAVSERDPWWWWGSPGSWEAFREWFNGYTLEGKYVSLSDGGHFDNLGVYELLRRRCRYIIVGDAEADPDLTFAALSHIIRLARIDFGIEIDIDTADLRKDPETGLSRSHCAMGRIYYPGGTVGYLLYFKSTLTGDEPEHLREYQVRHPKFPHETTADQWFNEMQFEAYRELGYHTAHETLKAALGREKPGDMEALFHAVKERWFPRSEAVARHFTRHAAELSRIQAMLKDDPDLGFMDLQIYPQLQDWERCGDPPRRQSGTRTDWIPGDPDLFRRGFYLCNLMMQLMENVYTDLNFAHESDHPDNRGWLNLFRHWAGAPMFRVAWVLSSGTYGARFQRFCEGKLGLRDLATLRILPSTGSDLPPAAAERLNPLERAILHHAAPDLEESAHTLALFYLDIVNPGNAQEYHCFHFGFALISGAGELILLRIQDHLRRMGLGRMALERMRQEGIVTEMAPLSADQEGWALEKDDRKAGIKTLSRMWGRDEVSLSPLKRK